MKSRRMGDQQRLAWLQRRCKRFGRWATLLCLGLSVSNVSSGQEPKVYVVNHADAPPTIDGLLTFDSEWDGASMEQNGQWATFNGVSDSTNNRFLALWDDAGLYLQHQVDYTSWPAPDPNPSPDPRLNWDPQGESLTFIFDPNTDGEANENTSIFGYSWDGYQLTVNQTLGESEIHGTNGSTGLFEQAYVDNLSAGGPKGVGPYSGFSGIVMKQSNSAETGTGYMELFIPWSDFDATDPNDGFSHIVDDIGLYHPVAPSAGEEWFFNIARTPQFNGLTHAWSSPLGAIRPNKRPHGILQFAEAAGNPCDVDGNGVCDATDIDAISEAVLNGDGARRFDRNADGEVTDADRIYYIETELNTWIGDANLDGEFGTQDFVAVFMVGGYEDGIPGNGGWSSGDWSGDLDFTTTDFVAAFQSGGYEMGLRAAVAAVPEPTSWVILSVGAVLLCLRRRSQ